GRVWELSVPAGGQWGAADLTVLTGAPPAAAGSSLSGYEFTGQNSKQVIYLDGGGHVHELSMTPGGQWAAADLTALTSAPPAVGGSPLSGYGWAAGNLSSKQVVYLDGGGHVHELSLAAGRG